MLQQLLWIETVVKLSAGIILAAFPVTVARVLGLPVGSSGFWARLVGCLLIGLAGANFIEGQGAGSKGLGMAGSVLINLIGSAMLITLLVLDSAATTARGRLILWLAAGLLLLLSLFEIAVV